MGNAPGVSLAVNGRLSGVLAWALDQDGSGRAVLHGLPAVRVGPLLKRGLGGYHLLVLSRLFD